MGVGFGCFVLGLGFKVRGSPVKGLGLRVQVLRLKVCVQSFGAVFCNLGFAVTVSCSDFRAWILGLEVRALDTRF